MGPQSRVSRRLYYREMKESKIVVSPFGWGEINNRDFESFIYGCLLVKPSVDHLITYPDFFLPNQTYLPYSWDFSDLEGLVENLRSNFDNFFDIAINGQEKYINETISRNGREKFVQYFCELLDGCLDEERVHKR